MGIVSYFIIFGLLVVFLSLWTYSKVEEKKAKETKKIEQEVKSIEEVNNSNENTTESTQNSDDNTVESMLYDIKYNTQDMLYWIRFWSILNLICYGIVLLIIIFGAWR
ncbi:MAG: hypothetical protein IJ180_03900 [Bacteroidales bacterium]|nr:hypothetical protein [Bacteroidales bacterium]